MHGSKRLIGKNEIQIRKLFVEMVNIARKFGLQINQEKTKIYDSGKEKQFKKIRHFKVKNYKFGRAENFKYLGVILNEDNNKQIDLEERIKNAKNIFYATKIFLK
jgi:hypothetical protein